jgi:hypothetical protein
MKKTIAILAAFALVAGFAATAAAADWSFYGSARMTTFSSTLSKEAPSNPMQPGLYDDTDTAWNLQGNSRIGANVSAGDVSGRFEYGTGVNLRILYGAWDFGGGQLLVGQTYTPVTQLLSSQVYNGDNGLLNMGEFYAGRQPMIQLTFGGFKVALVRPSTTLGSGGPSTDVDTILPKIEASYKFSTDMFFVTPYGGYNSVDAVNALDQDEGIDSYVAGIAGGVTLGPANIKANFYMAQNPVAYGATAGTAGAPTDGVDLGAGVGTPIWNGTSFVDMDEMGGLLLASFKFSDMIGLEAGIGYKNQEYDNAGQTWERDVMTYYAQVPITLADGVDIIPEVGMYDFGDLEQTGLADVDLGDLTYIGAKWMINF